MILEDITNKESFVHRKQQIHDLFLSVDEQGIDIATDNAMDLLQELAEQSYIAGMNRLNLTSPPANSSVLQGYVGDEAVLVKNFLKDKGLCQ